MAEKKKRVINLLDWRRFPRKCDGAGKLKDNPTNEELGGCFYVEKVTNSVKFIAGTKLTYEEVKKLSKNSSWTVNIRAPKDADFKD